MKFVTRPNPQRVTTRGSPFERPVSAAAGDIKNTARLRLNVGGQLLGGI